MGSVYVNFRIEVEHVEVEAQVDTVDRTGVEMEALTACAIAALTIYDMCKSIDRSMTIGELALWEKTGGRSGTYRRPSVPGRRRVLRPLSRVPFRTPGRPLTCPFTPPFDRRQSLALLGCPRMAAILGAPGVALVRCRAERVDTGALTLTIAVILILGLIWAAVLIPPILRARSQQPRNDSVGDFHYKLSMLGHTNGTHRKRPDRVSTSRPAFAPVGRGPAKQSHDAEAPPRGAVHPHRHRRGHAVPRAAEPDAAAVRGEPRSPTLLLAGYIYLLIQYKQRASEQQSKVRFLNTAYRTPAPYMVGPPVVERHERVDRPASRPAAPNRFELARHRGASGSLGADRRSR